MYDLLLTGSVIQYCPYYLPYGVWDTQTRLHEYLCSIQSWLQCPNIEKIVYCDAGGYRFPDGMFPEERFESITVDLVDLVYERGRGAAELASIRYAMENSRFLGNMFFKCTGRLFVNNFDDLLRHIEQDLADRPSHIGYFAMESETEDDPRLDTRFCLIDHLFYENQVCDLAEKVNDYEYANIIERLFLRHLKEYRKLPRPAYVGRSGFSNEPYSADYPEEIKSKASERLKTMQIPTSDRTPTREQIMKYFS